MNNDIYEKLGNLESYVEKAIFSFAGFCILSKRTLKSLILDICNSLPEELRREKEYLERVSADNIFSLLAKLDYIIENSKDLYGLSIIRQTEIFNILDEIRIAITNNLREVSCKQ